MAALTNRSVPVLPGAVVKSFYAASNLSQKAGYIVKLSGGQAVLSTSGTSKNFGVVAVGGASSGDMATIVIDGPAYFKANSTCSNLQYVTATSDGTGTPTTTTGHYMVGKCVANVSAGTYGMLIVDPLEHFKN